MGDLAPRSEAHGGAQDPATTDTSDGEPQGLDASLESGAGDSSWRSRRSAVPMARQTQPQPGPAVSYSDEQLQVITSNEPRIVCRAFAGGGKTTMAIGFAAARPREPWLYLCLNKANAEEAKKRFGPNVTAATTHSVAWRALGMRKDRIAERWNPMVLMDQLRLRTPREAGVAMRILNAYFCSGERDISDLHAEEARAALDLSPGEVMNGVAHAALAWARMNDSSSGFRMPHDAYLKMFALSAPKLDYAGIIFDEFQDANPVTLQVVLGQRGLKLLGIGDPYQNIYGFRGSVNAIEQLEQTASAYNLTRTWRFGPRIAGVANHLLHELRGEKQSIVGMGKDQDWGIPRQETILTRTNIKLFQIAAPMRGEGVHWVGGCEKYRLGLIEDAYRLYSRQYSAIEDAILRRRFGSWADYVDYAEAANDGEARILVKVIEEFTHGIPDLVHEIRANEVKEPGDAAMVLSTAHSSKGLEFDRVRIGDDFEVLDKAEAALAAGTPEDLPTQDVNLLYVAITRARSAVCLNDETNRWLQDLPLHRTAREAAAVRRHEELNRIRAQIDSIRPSRA